jgi:invasion protein IalB
MRTATTRILVAALLGAAALAGRPALAQLDSSGTVKSQHGAWSVVCDTPPGSPGEQCILRQNVELEDRPGVGLSVVAFKTADKQAQYLRIIAPLGVLLFAPGDNGGPSKGGIGLNIDGKDFGRVPFVRCFADGCRAEVPLSDEILKTFSAAKTAVFILFETPEPKGAFGIPVDLAGFGDGVKALP